MMKCEKTEFCVEGRFLGYEFKDGYKIKRLTVATADAELSIKMTKSARLTLERTLLPGDYIRVAGVQKRESAKTKLKAYWIQPIELPTRTNAIAQSASATEIAQLEMAMQPSTKPQPQANILMCQKSSCMKKGGRELCKALDAALTERGLQEQVKVKGTGCMKACGKGPNLVFPGKVRYTKISAKDIPALVNEHFEMIEPAAISAKRNSEGTALEPTSEVLVAAS